MGVAGQEPPAGASADVQTGRVEGVSSPYDTGLSRVVRGLRFRRRRSLVSPLSASGGNGPRRARSGDWLRRQTARFGCRDRRQQPGATLRGSQLGDLVAMERAFRPRCGARLAGMPLRHAAAGVVDIVSSQRRDRAEAVD
jgi:hypothetical protein